LKRSFINSNPHLHKEKEMVDFRKALLVLAVLVFAAGIVSAQAVNPLQCVANAGVPPIARAEGVAEEVGQVIISCTGGTPTALGAPIPTVNVQIFLNTFVTSRLLDSTTLRSEAMLLIDEPQRRTPVWSLAWALAPTVRLTCVRTYSARSRLPIARSCG
jgi:hypothetical protein